jgi:hypothetical protein
MVATHDALPEEETWITCEFNPDGRQYNCGQKRGRVVRRCGESKNRKITKLVVPNWVFSLLLRIP